MSTSPFLEKLVSNLDKIDSRQIQLVLENLAREKSFFKIILENMDEGVVVCNPQLQILYLNPSARKRLAPLSRRALEGKSLPSLSPATKFTEFLTQNRFDTHKSLTREIHFDGPEPALVSVSAYPVISEEQEALSVVFILRDVTETRREQEQQQLAEKLSSLATLTAGVAHEIRNPLNAMDIHAQLLLQMVRDARGVAASLDIARLERSSQIIQEEIRRLSTIVDNFLQTVRPSRPRLELTVINDLVHKELELFKPECELRQIRLKLDLDPEIPRLPLDAEQFKQALFNVIKNALEAIKHEHGEIALRTFLNRKGLNIQVEDNGEGISKKDLALIFEPYYTTKPEGSGLGLMNVFRIVREHQGEISVDSAEDQGTRFTITLPLGKKPVKLLPIEGETTE